MTIPLPATLVERLPAIVGKPRASVRYGPIGIDFGASGIRLVQFVSRDNTLALGASALVPVSAPARASAKQTRAILRKAFRQYGFTGRDVVTCLPPDDVKIMMISYQHQAGRSDQDQIVERVAERVDGAIENHVIDFIMIRPQVKEGQARSALVAIAQREKVIDYLEFLRKAGLAVKLLEIESTAIRRLVLVKHGHDHEANLITVSMGHAQTYITVLSGRRLIYERDINIGEVQLLDMLCRELDIDEHEARAMLSRSQRLDLDAGDDEQSVSVTEGFYAVLKPLFMELVQDINRALVYAVSETRGMPVEHVYLTNVVAAWRGIEKFVDSLIDVPVSVLAPFDGFGNVQRADSDADPRGALVAGMALHGLSEAG